MIADILDSFATEIQQLDESQPLGKMLADIYRTTGWFSWTSNYTTYTDYIIISNYVIVTL